jgi:2-polyprenyl-3-methyl-5-hydroxy-6-metoxy-1,4-benzoquinol methylase
MSDRQDRFSGKAERYENNAPRVINVKTIAAAILRKCSFSKDQRIMDFGSGTGLLTQEIAPHVGHITAIDMSPAMNEVLRGKAGKFECELEIVEIDLSESSIDRSFDAIISSMTIHHVENISAILAKFYAMLKPGGAIALADLVSEDGSFHKDNEGVFHFGFDPDEFLDLARKAGFENLQSEIVSTARKPYGDYPIFLLTGRKAS